MSAPAPSDPPAGSDALAEVEGRPLEDRPDGYLALLEELRGRLEDPGAEG